MFEFFKFKRGLRTLLEVSTEESAVSIDIDEVPPEILEYVKAVDLDDICITDNEISIIDMINKCHNVVSITDIMRECDLDSDLQNK